MADIRILHPVTLNSPGEMEFLARHGWVFGWDIHGGAKVYIRRPAAAREDRPAPAICDKHPTCAKPVGYVGCPICDREKEAESMRPTANDETDFRTIAVVNALVAIGVDLAPWQVEALDRMMIDSAEDDEEWSPDA